MTTREQQENKVFFRGGRPRGPHDYLRMGAKILKNFLLGSIIIGQLTLGLWEKHERLWGAQRKTTYVEKTVKREKHLQILAVNVYFTGSGTYNRDQYLPGWNTGNNTVDCIGGGGAGGSDGWVGVAGGGGGGGMARYSNVGALGATFSLAVGGGGGGAAYQNGGAGGNTQLDGWVGAYGGGGGQGYNNVNQTTPGGAGGTYYAGTGYYAGGTGGQSAGTTGGGGGGAAGRYGGGSNGSTNGGNGGPGGGAGGGMNAGGGNGGEWQANVGSGGGGGGAGWNSWSAGGPGGAYGAGGGAGSVVYQGPVFAGGNGCQGLIAIVYEPLTAPVISSCSPNAGPTAGGQAVAIYGSGFYNIASVNIGGAPLTGISYNANAIYGTTSAGGAGTYNINVIVTGGVPQGTGGSLYSYVNPPSVSGCNPVRGLTLGGALITVTGSNFNATSSVIIGGVAATNVVQVNGNTITCNTPAHAPGLVNITVNGAYGTSTIANAFTYVLPAAGFNMPMSGV